jgi:hypothetical protein
MKLIKILLSISTICGAIVFIIGMTIMPQTSGAVVPYDKSSEQYNQEQQNLIIQSSGFKMAIGGSAACVLSIFLLICKMYYEQDYEEKNTRIQIVPYPRLEGKVKGKQAQTQAQPQAQLQVTEETLTEIVVVKPEDYNTRITLPPRMSLPPRMPVFNHGYPQRTFKYPTPYEAFNKK